MNRIYQGRVTAVQILKPGTKNEWEPLPDGEAALWRHHELFQDAVNYYIVALASLGTSPDGKLTRLRGLLEQVWTDFDKKGQRRQGMGDSLKRAWQLDAPPTLAETVRRFQQPLIADKVPLTTAELAAEFLVFKLGGETSIKNNGPVFFPMFCDPESEPTYLLSAGRRGRADDEGRLREELHRELAQQDIVALSKSITLGSVVNLQPGTAPDTGEVVIARIKEAAKTYSSKIPEAQLASWLSKLSADFSLPKNRGGAINIRRVHACVLFLAFPNETTKALFQSTFPAPKLLRKKAADSDDEDKIRDEDFMVDGDDPIKLSRGTRGLVFVGFTALPIWQGGGRLLHWKRFDIEAFKEALKVYNQFQQNLEKREQNLDGLASKLLLMDGELVIQSYADDTDAGQRLRSRLSRIWQETKGKPKAPKNESGEEPVLASFNSDPRIARLRRIITDDLAEEYRLTDGRRTPYGLRRRTMKGWAEVRRQWLKTVKPETPFSEELRGKLKGELDALRAGEKREQIGSHKLFEALIADAEAWAIWREPDAVLQEKINKGWAADPLDTFREYCETREAFEEVSERALNFTPADARYSRRLFMFTDACSFGKDTGDYKHDPKALAVIVPVATEGPDGRLAEQRCRITYSAPRLLRDQIRDDDGGYAQDWVQPMMRALFGESEITDNPQDLKEAAVQLMPDYDGKGQKRVLLNFPLKLDETKLRDRLGKHALWQQQFVTWKKGSQLPFLRWDSEFDGKEPHQWAKKVSGFRALAADLGTRHAASVALLECGKARSETARFIGRAGDNDWFARYRTGSILRLPGENTVVLRPESKLDDDQRGKDFREELYGERGRSATEQECEETFGMLNALGQANLLADISATADLRTRHSLPEQNDKLLVAMRRAQNWIAACVSWHWKLTAPEAETQRGATLEQLQEQDRMPAWQKLAAQGDAGLPDLRRSLHDHIVSQRKVVEQHLLALTRRILPLRGREWEWVIHPDNASCHLLRQAPAQPNQAKVKLRGQRGLSMARIEQLAELRRRWQSLNQALRREIGQRPPTAAEMRNDPIPDPCPDILRKLENIREQRVNQTAHLIVAEALGLKLKAPELPAERRTRTDTHGEYRVLRPPADFIVLEDLSRYLSDQGRAKSENSRLMKWCHRAISLKVKMLAEPFGIPVLETPAAYTSRFCSLTGAAGFRAAEVGWKDRHEFRWRILLEEAKTLREAGKPVPENADFAERLFTDLEKISRSEKPHLTLLAPQPGGPIFVTAKGIIHPKPGKNRYVLPMQADINAAVNIALRAIAHPDRAEIHHRLRTERKKGTGTKPDTFTSREPRRFCGEKMSIIPEKNDLPKETNTNMFFDQFEIAPFGRARLETDPISTFPYASGPALWKTVNDRVRQWSRCQEINNTRFAKWQRNTPDADDIPM